MTYENFTKAADSLSVTLQTRRRTDRPDGLMADMRGASHFDAVLYRSGLPFWRGIFSMGAAHKGAPTVDDVFGSIVRDAACAEESRDSFIAEMGYDPVMGAKVYKACRAIRKALLVEFGAETLDSLYETEY